MTAGAFSSSGDLSADRRFLWAAASEREGDLAVAIDLYAQAADAAPAWPAAWLSLGRCRALAGDQSGALEAYSRALSLDPADVLGASLLIARMTGEPTPAMSPGYVAGLFDDYAARFDRHLVETLGYRGPQILVEALAGIHHGHYGEALDLGCGTGLMGAALAGKTTALDGIDLSDSMLRLAEARALYRTLLRDDIVRGTEQLSESLRYDLVLAADVLVYLGDLSPLFRVVRRALKPDGLFAFTVQMLEGEGDHRLGSDMRFHHSAAYLKRTAIDAGFRTLSFAEATTRKDGGRDVPGFVVILG